MPKHSYHQEHRGRSYRGERLTGRDFSFADLRGTDFSNAILVGASFSHAKTGLGNYSKLIIAFGVFLLSVLSSFISAFISMIISALLITGGTYNSSNETAYGLESVLFSIITLITLTLFCVILIRQGAKSVLLTFQLILVGVVILFLALIPVTPTSQSSQSIVTLAILQPLVSIGALVGITLGSLVWATSTSVLGGLATFTTGGGVLVGTVSGALAGGVALEKFQRESSVFAIILTILLFLFSTYIGRRALAGDAKYSLIQAIALFLSTRTGTCFRSADLTEADFTEARLEHADFSEADLTRTCWRHVKNLHKALTWGTYLENLKVRNLVVSGYGRDEIFEDLDLRGLNLQSAYLARISFNRSNLSEANLRHADLSGASLVQTQLYRAFLTSACLTGAYIQDWGISPETKLEDIRCDYIYMRLPTKDNPEPWRKPDNRIEKFQKGDFDIFMTPIIKTLDLYRSQNFDLRTLKTLDLFHHEGVDPIASIVALKELQEEYPEAELKVVALEGRGRNNIRIQANVSSDADNSTLNDKYFTKYRRISSSPASDLQSLLAKIEEKDLQIQRLLDTFKSSGGNRFYIETVHNMGDTVSEQGSININAGRDISGIINLGKISGNVTNAISKLPDSPEPDKPGLKELLSQLQAAFEAETQLSDEDKAEALEQVQVLAEAGKKPDDGTLQKVAKTAMKILKGTVSSLPTVTKLVEESAKLLPAITTLLTL